MIEYHFPKTSMGDCYTITRQPIFVREGMKKEYHGMYELLELVIESLNHDGRYALANAVERERKELFFDAGPVSRG